MKRNSNRSSPSKRDISTRDALVLKHLRLVKAIAIRVHESLPVHVELDDLVNAGTLGLLDAADKYKPEKNVAFALYAKHRIKGAVIDSLRQLDWASRDQRRRQKHFETVHEELAKALKRNPTQAEMADKLGMDISRYQELLGQLQASAPHSASTPLDEELPTPDFAASPEHQPDHMCAKQEMRSAVDSAVNALPERYHKLVFLYYTKDLTMREIGDLLGVNESRISQMHRLALQRMEHVLKSNGIHSGSFF